MRSEMEKCYTVNEVAKILDISARTVRKRIENGLLQACQLKGNPQAPYLIPESFLAEFIGANSDLPEVKNINMQRMRNAVNLLYEARKKYEAE